MSENADPSRVAAGPARRATWIAAVIVAVFAALMLKNAWLCDDAYISFRTVDNFVAGLGLRFNADERVQTFTNPLWTLVVAAFYAVTHEMYRTAFFVSVTTSLAAAVLFVRQASGRGRIVAAVLLVGSKAFVDFSTSGLENPLSHLLLVVFLGLFLADGEPADRLLPLAFVAALAAVNRLDAILIYAPALALCLSRRRSWRGVATIAVGFLPLVLWLAFALFYYGFALPTSAHAKLATGFPESVYVAQGVRYFGDSFAADPWTLLVIAAGVTAAALRRDDRASVAVALGCAAYLAYVLVIGGDFMSGRFFALPYLAAAALLARSPWIERLGKGALVGAAVAAWVLLSTSAPAHLLSGPHFGDISDVPVQGDANLWPYMHDGICDQRQFYHQAAGLFRPGHASRPTHAWAAQGIAARTSGSRVVVSGALGFLGFEAGPDVHVVDPLGLADPLLARLPAWRGQPFTIGHFGREFPAGLKESLATGTNQIEDPGLHAYYDEVRLATRAPLFADGRFAAIWDLNFGDGDRMLEAYVATHERGAAK